MISRISTVAVFALLGGFFVSSALASNNATLKIEQVSTQGYGEWSLLYGSNSVQSTDRGQNARHQTLFPEPGNLLLRFIPPSGATTVVKVFKDGELLEESSVPQIDFLAETGSVYKVSAQYTFDQVGTISVTSTPLGQTFRLMGPNGKVLRGKTPTTFENAVMGRYSLKMNAKRGCVLPRPVTKTLRVGERLALEGTFVCKRRSEKRVKPRTTTVRELRRMIKAREDFRSRKHRDQ